MIKKPKYLTVEQEQVYNLLPTSPCQLHYNDIASLTGIRQRNVRIIIQELRNMGVPIACIPKDGYWIVENPQDLMPTINMLKNTRDTLNDTINALILAYDKLLEEEDV
jgi:biotin operon repressor|nr:MAG TPA_asm: Cyclic nucleotide-binding domain protein [Caudoviricetes sp.]DAX93267.1 MAG TPA: Cyclic nucleotide-binding domain protein [Caudoviricetes sp.]